MLVQLFLLFLKCISGEQFRSVGGKKQRVYKLRSAVFMTFRPASDCFADEVSLAEVYVLTEPSNARNPPHTAQGKGHVGSAALSRSRTAVSKCETQCLPFLFKNHLFQDSYDKENQSITKQKQDKNVQTGKNNNNNNKNQKNNQHVRNHNAK